MNKTRKMRLHRTREKTPVFHADDFQSNDGMLTTIWGPPMWHYLHTMSFNYPVKPSKKDKKAYRDFVLNLQNVLPCGKCRENLKHNFKRLPLSVSKMKKHVVRRLLNLHGNGLSRQASL